MPRIEATDRSISPLMMISVMGSAMIAISPELTPVLKKFVLVRNCGEVTAPKMMIATNQQAQAGLPAQRGPGGDGEPRGQVTFQRRNSFVAARPAAAAR